MADSAFQPTVAPSKMGIMKDRSRGPRRGVNHHSLSMLIAITISLVVALLNDIPWKGSSTVGVTKAREVIMRADGKDWWVIKQPAGLTTSE